ncbi:MAG TPA: family 20 glycosylhydrolase [Chitinophagaceae bacterium]|nr:family 20 glycosylhydrolase [Chitinophagaceae bacterium]
MIRIFLLPILVVFCVTSFCQDKTLAGRLIPLPVSIKEGNGNFILNNKTDIHVISADPAVSRVANYLAEKLKTTGLSVSVIKASTLAGNSIILSIINDASLGSEGYKLDVTSNSVKIGANKPAGIFYGMQTLIQLMPKEIEDKNVVKNITWQIPVCSIKDYPRFGWRGLMFDVSRHFFTKEEVKKYIDEMVKYKYNLLHLHLTDDEGWRIEIKGLPRLTEVGAWNVKRVGYFGTFAPPEPDEPRTYGGFYTQDDIKEIVQYAKDRFVNILPEIDVPGHSLAAIAAYPELACSAGGKKPEVSSGENIKDWSTHTALIDDNLCPANENVYEFLDKVLTEVAQLFPFEYIHMGGDETFKTFWEKSDAVKALMQKEGLKNMEEVQSYFEKRVEKIVESKGKKFMGWDEILEGGLAPSAAVMSWRGMKGGIEAAKMKHDVVMSPTDFVYIDYMQGDPIIEPHIYSTLRLKKAYAFEPVPEGVDSKYIIGGQANLWTEQVYTFRHAEYMTWPRAFAISEALWSPKEKRNWDNFFPRVENQFMRFDVAEINYAPSVYDPIFNVSTAEDKQLKVELSTEPNGLDIYYTFDNTFPDRFSPKYTAPLIVPKGSVMLKVITYKGKNPVGRLIYMPIEELQKRADKK